MHSTWGSQPPTITLRVLVTGATGFIGRALTRMLVDRGDQVSMVSRNPSSLTDLPNACEAVDWIPDLDPFDAIVNLAGEPLIGKRWNEGQRNRIKSSRVNATNRIVDALGEATQPPKVLVNASAIGIYGNRSNDWLNEESKVATDFVGGVCTAWEAAAARANEHGVRSVAIRIGVVLGKGGGAIDKMLLPFKLGLGGPMGNGQQWMSWIHLHDLCRLILHAIDDDNLRGPYNGTAPNPVTNKQFSTTLGKALHRPAIVPTPAFALRIALGEVASLLTDSQRCQADKVLATGFEFKHVELESALQSVLSS